jgi:predicted amidophosphoribosyltransferase
MKSLSDLIFPSRCIGCFQLGISICSICRKGWHPHIYQRQLSVNMESFPVISAVQYSPIASRVLLSAKESNLLAADELVIAAISHSLHFFLKRFGPGDLIAIPSRKSATRKRGRNFLADITDSVAANTKLNSVDLLRHVRSVRDQSELNLQERNRNIAGALSSKPNFGGNGNNAPLIIVDDLITTGATLAEAIRALRAAGFAVKGAVTGSTAKPLR